MNTNLSAQISFPDLPEGTVTFLFTDIEGSTKLLHRLRESYATLLADQRRILRESFANWRGHEVDTQGDAFFVAFSRGTQAVCAAVEVQHKLAEHAWPEGVAVRVRMGIHTGEPWNAEEGYVGMDVHRAARIAHVGHGGQVLLSETTTALVRDELPSGVSLCDLGRHLLKDIHRPEHISQLMIEGLQVDFPPLTSLQSLPAEGARLPRQVGKCPYRGLSAFQETDAPFYFGRETFIDALEQAVCTKKMVAVIVGSSGSGKSSALYAGLLPRLRQAGGYQFAAFRPGSQPFYSVAGALLPLLEDGLSKTELLAETQKLAERLENGEVRLMQVVERIRADSNGAGRVLLVADQFEELYTLCPDVKTQKAFIDELLTLVEAAKGARDAPAVILLTMRADFMGQALSHRAFADALQEASLLMGPMTRQELHTAIEKPAEMQGAAFEPGLVERILDDVGEKPGNLPLLEFTLTQLWEQQTDGWLTHTDYEAMGCVEGALAAYADQVYAGLEADEQEYARRALVQLVQPGEGTEDTRRIATRQELGEESWKLIQHLADRRLVVTGRDARGREIAEVVHEALIQKWGRFQEWMDADRDFRAWQERLRTNLRQWQESEQDEGALLAGAPLAVAQSWLAERGEYVSPLEAQYIEASLALQARQEKERQQRRQRTIIGLAAGLVVAVALITLVFLQRQSARVQAAVLLAGQAENELAKGYHDRAVLLALTALEDYPYMPEAERALGKAVTYNQALQLYTGHTSAVTSLDWSPDGSKIATSSTDNTVRIWDPATGETMRVIELPEGITGNIYDWALAVKWTPDGRRLVTLSGDRFLLGSQDYDLLLWDAATGELLKSIQLPNQAEPEQGEGSITTMDTHYPTSTAINFAPESKRIATIGGDNTAIVWDEALQAQDLILTGHSNDVNGIDWSPGEQQLATASEDGTARIWDAQTGKNVMTLAGHNGAVNVALWSPDGKQVATGGDDGLVLIWDAETGQIATTIDPKGGIVWTVAWSPDGKNIVIGTHDKVIRIWDIAANEEVGSLRGHDAFLTALAFSPDGRRFASAANDGLARVWQERAGTIQTLPYRGGGQVLDWSSDSRFLALADLEQRKVVIWDVATGEGTVLETEFDYEDYEVSYSPNDQLLFIRGVTSLPPRIVNADPQYIVDAATGETVLEVKASDGVWIRDAGWSPDGTHFATGTMAGTVDVWDLRTGKILRSMQHGQNAMVDQVEWSPDGKKIVSAGSGSVARIWDAETGEQLLTLTGHEPPTSVWSAKWSPDGKYILTTSGYLDIGAPDNTVRIWDANTGRNIRVIDKHTQQVTSGDWSPDGTRVATISADGTMRVWDARSGAELLNLLTPTRYAGDVEWSPDGKFIAISPDGFVKVIRAWQSTEELLNYAKQCCVFRELTSSERKQFGLQ